MFQRISMRIRAAIKRRRLRKFLQAELRQLQSEARRFDCPAVRAELREMRQVIGRSNGSSLGSAAS